MIVRRGTTAKNGVAITALRRTSDLFPGLWVYGHGADVETRIQTVDSASQVSLDKAAVATGNLIFEFTSAGQAIYLERSHAFRDVRDELAEHGDIVEFTLRTESDIRLDAYNSITKREAGRKIQLRSYPVEFNPQERRLEKAGIRIAAEVVVWTAMQDWIDAGVDFKDIDFAGRTTVKIQGETYVVKQKALVSQMADSYCYITFGLVQK